jgi:phage terminase small subunit
MTMTPFDTPPEKAEKSSESKDRFAACATALECENKISTNAEPSAPAPPTEALPPCWQLGPGEPANQLYIYGPHAAVIEEPPPHEAEPPDPEETVGPTLNARQLAFCERYVECPVAARAAREAGYAASTAADHASRLLKHPNVMRRIIELRRKHRLEAAFRRETLLDKFEAVFADALERHEFYAAIQALTMEARLAQIAEAMPGFRYAHRVATAGEQVVWDAVSRLEQKLSELTVGNFAGAAAAVKAPEAAPTAPAARPAERR